MSQPWMYINIILDTVLATDVNKYSLASASCQPIWRTLVVRTGSIFSCCKGLWDCRVLKPITTKHQSVFWLVSQSRRMSAICVGICRWISLASASADPVVITTGSALADVSVASDNCQLIWPTGVECCDWLTSA